jgi:hypothetical protein
MSRNAAQSDPSEAHATTVFTMVHTGPYTVVVARHSVQARHGSWKADGGIVYGFTPWSAMLPYTRFWNRSWDCCAATGIIAVYSTAATTSSVLADGPRFVFLARSANAYGTNSAAMTNQ